MKKILLVLFYLNIYVFQTWLVMGQELTLDIKAEKPISKGLLDTLELDQTFKNFASLQNKLDSIYSYIQRIGYLESEFKNLERINDSTFIGNFFIGENFDGIKIFYSESDFSKKELQRISQNVEDSYLIIPFDKITEALQTLTALKSDDGNTFAKLRLTNIEREDNKTLTAKLIYESGKTRKIDSLVLKGYEKFPASFLKYYAGIKKGGIFNKKKLLAQSENLNSLGFVNTIKPPEALFKKDSTIVYLYLEKQQNNNFDGILGFTTNEETQKLEFNGFLNLELNNNLNFGEQLVLNYKADGSDQKNFRVKATLPYLFKTPFGISAELKIFKRDSTFVTTTQEARLLYQIKPTSSAYVGYKAYESSNLLEQIIGGTPLVDYSSKFLVVGLNYIKTQNRKLFPIKSDLFIDSELGKRATKLAEDEQVKLSIGLSNIFNLSFTNAIYIKNATSILFSENFLVNELSRFGGINSIRGFNENSIDATFFSVLNTEYRYIFNPATYVHSIIDLGYFENETQALKKKLYSFGIGLGIDTRAGIFKFNIANGTIENEPFNFSNTKIHVGLTSRF